jgi:apolipoprotein N-acyltransferase
MLGSGLMALAFPPQNCCWTGWLGLALWAYGCLNTTTVAQAVLSGLISGYLVHAYVFNFIRTANYASGFVFNAPFLLGWIAVSVLGAITWSIKSMSFRALGHHGWPLCLALPFCWTGIDLVASNFCRAAFGVSTDFLMLGMWATKLPLLLQLADLGGAFAVGWLIESVAGCLCDLCYVTTVRTKRSRVLWSIGISGSQVVATASYGMCQMTYPALEGPRLAICPNSQAIPVSEVLKTLDTPVDSAAMIVCSEVSHAVTLDTRVQPFPPSNLSSLVEKVECPVLLGCQRIGRGTAPGLFNSLVLVSHTSGVVDVYDKMHLTPFMESDPIPRPFRPMFNTLHLACDGTSEYQPGRGPVVMSLPDSDWRIATGICHDICFWEWGQRNMMSPAKPHFLIQSANELPDASGCVQHFLLACAQLRAVESRRAIVRCVRGGYSALIDANGSILQCASPVSWDQPFLTVPIPIDARRSWCHHGGVAGLMLWLLFVGVAVEVMPRFRRQYPHKVQ